MTRHGGLGLQFFWNISLKFGTEINVSKGDLLIWFNVIINEKCSLLSTPIFK